MKTAFIITFVLALLGGGLFLFGVSRDIYSFEMTGFILTLPITLLAAISLGAVLVGILAVIAMAAWSALLWAWARAWPRHRRG
jgi:hypothetical protein